MSCIRTTEARRHEALVVAAARGDRAALEELLAVVRPLLVGYTTARLVEPSDVDGVVAQVVDDVVAALPGMTDRRTPFPGWVYGLAAWRVSGANAGFGGGRVEMLRPQDREVIALRMAGVGVDETARRLFVSRATVRTFLQRATSRLRKLEPQELVEVVLALRDEAAMELSRSEDLEEDTGSLDLVAARRELAADAHASHDPEPDLVRALASLPDEEARPLRSAAAHDDARPLRSAGAHEGALTTGQHWRGEVGDRRRR